MLCLKVVEHDAEVKQELEHAHEQLKQQLTESHDELELLTQRAER